MSKRALPPPPPAVASQDDAPAAPAAPAALSPSADIPPHVWDLLQRAGETAAARLLAILEGPAFDSYAPSAKARLIELAMVRAYGLPVRRSVSVELSSSDADAVAASIAALSSALPERAARARDVTPDRGQTLDADLAAPDPLAASRSN